MGRRTPTESIAAIYQAFLRQRTWAQAELARDVGIEVSQLRKRLTELGNLGMPLHKEEDHPHVFWSVPPSWFPGGLALPTALVPDLLHALWHLPRSARRKKLLAAALGAVQKAPAVAEAEGSIVTRPASDAEEKLLPLVEEAMAQRMALRVRYRSAKSRVAELRHVSVHRAYVEPPARLAVMCHRSGILKWFRVEFLSSAEADGNERFREVDPSKLEEFLETSIDGFHSGDAAQEHAFVVREPEAGWVARSLLDPMAATAVDDGGIRVTARTAGVNRVARFVVGLGDAARCETEELRCEVERLARGAVGIGNGGAGE